MGSMRETTRAGFIPDKNPTRKLRIIAVNKTL